MKSRHSFLCLLILSGGFGFISQAHATTSVLADFYKQAGVVNQIEQCKTNFSMSRKLDWFMDPSSDGKDRLDNLIFCHRLLQASILDKHHRDTSDDELSDFQKQYKAVQLAVDQIYEFAESNCNGRTYRKIVDGFGAATGTKNLVSDNDGRELAGCFKLPNKFDNLDNLGGCYEIIDKFLAYAHAHQKMQKKDFFETREAKAEKLFGQELFKYLKSRADALMTPIRELAGRHKSADAITALTLTLQALHKRLDELSKAIPDTFGPDLKIVEVKIGEFAATSRNHVAMPHAKLACNITAKFKMACTAGKATDGWTVLPGGCKSTVGIESLRSKLAAPTEDCAGLTTAVPVKIRVKYVCNSRSGIPMDIKGMPLPDSKKPTITFDKMVDLVCPAI